MTMPKLIVTPVFLSMLALGACSHEPLDYIPKSDRAFLEAQQRLDGGPQGSGKTSVEAMLARAKAANDGKASDDGSAVERGVASLTFSDDQVQPDDGQRKKIAMVVQQAKRQGVATIIASRGEGKGPEALLGPRRAMAVAHIVENDIPNVKLKFDKTIPPGQIILSAGDIPGEKSE